MSFWDLVTHEQAWYLRHVGLVRAEAKGIYQRIAEQEAQRQQ